MIPQDRHKIVRMARRRQSTQHRVWGGWSVVSAVFLAVSLLFLTPGSASSLPFRALDDTGTFTASELTRPYEIDLNYLLDVEKTSRVDLAVLDVHGWFPANDVPYDPNTHDIFQWAEEDIPTDQLTPEQEVAEESPTAGGTMGIPGPIAIGGAILGGVGLLVSILADIF